MFQARISQSSFAIADALYLAKNRGRNCVVTADDGETNRLTGTRRGALALISGRFKLHK